MAATTFSGQARWFDERRPAISSAPTSPKLTGISFCISLVRGLVSMRPECLGPAMKSKPPECSPTKLLSSSTQGASNSCGIRVEEHHYVVVEQLFLGNRQPGDLPRPFLGPLLVERLQPAGNRHGLVAGQQLLHQPEFPGRSTGDEQHPHPFAAEDFGLGSGSFVIGFVEFVFDGLDFNGVFEAARFLDGVGELHPQPTPCFGNRQLLRGDNRPRAGSAVRFADFLLHELYSDFASLQPLSDDHGVDFERFVLPDLLANIEVGGLQIPRPRGVANADDQERNSPVPRFASGCAGVVLTGVLTIGKHHDGGRRFGGQRFADRRPNVRPSSVRQERGQGPDGWLFRFLGLILGGIFLSLLRLRLGGAGINLVDVVGEVDSTHFAAGGESIQKFQVVAGQSVVDDFHARRLLLADIFGALPQQFADAGGGTGVLVAVMRVHRKRRIASHDEGRMVGAVAEVNQGRVEQDEHEQQHGRGAERGQHHLDPRGTARHLPAVEGVNRIQQCRDDGNQDEDAPTGRLVQKFARDFRIRRHLAEVVIAGEPEQVFPQSGGQDRCRWKIHGCSC